MDLFFPLLFLLSVFLDGALQSGAFDRTEYCPVYFYPHDFFCMGGGGIVGKEGLYVAEKDDIKRAARGEKGLPERMEGGIAGYAPGAFEGREKYDRP